MKTFLRSLERWECMLPEARKGVAAVSHAPGCKLAQQSYSALEARGSFHCVTMTQRTRLSQTLNMQCLNKRFVL